MMNNQEHLSDLAFGLIQGTLSVADKAVAHQLIMDSPEFRQMLKQEIALKTQMQALKEPASAEQKNRVFSKIVDSKEQLIYKKVIGIILEATLPPIAWPVLKILQRSVFAYE